MSSWLFFLSASASVVPSVVSPAPPLCTSDGCLWYCPGPWRAFCSCEGALPSRPTPRLRAEQSLLSATHRARGSGWNGEDV